MRKIILAMLGGIFMLPYVSESYAYMDAAVEKTVGNSIDCSKNIRKSDSVYVIAGELKSNRNEEICKIMCQELCR